MIADFLGMTSADLKETLAFLAGIAILVFQYLNNKAAHDAKKEAEAAKVTTQTARAETNQKIDTLSTTVDGKVQQLIDRTAQAAKSEGKEEGKLEARVEEATMRHAVKDALASAAPAIAAEVAKVVPPATPPEPPKENPPETNP